MSRSRASRKTRERCQDLSFCSDMVPEHDQSQPSRDYDWSFNGYGGTSFLDHLEPETDTYCQSVDSSRHLSLTTASLKRLVKEENAVSDNITPPRTLAPAQTSTSRILSVNNHEPSSSLTAVSSPCKFCSLPYLSGPSLPAHHISPFYKYISAHHSIWELVLTYTFPRTLLLLGYRV
jgi:hypothetical protein